MVQWEILDEPQPQRPASTGSSNDHLTVTGLPTTHPAGIAHADSIQQASVIQEAIAKKQDEERQALAAKQTMPHTEIQLAANSAAKTVLLGSPSGHKRTSAGRWKVGRAAEKALKLNDAEKRSLHI